MAKVHSQLTKRSKSTTCGRKGLKMTNNLDDVTCDTCYALETRGVPPSKLAISVAELRRLEGKYDQGT